MKNHIPRVDEATNSLMEEIAHIELEKKKLQSVKLQLRTNDQKTRLKSLQNKLTMLKKKLPSDTLVKKHHQDMTKTDEGVDEDEQKLMQEIAQVETEKRSSNLSSPNFEQMIKREG